jgi:hypothetical protein
VCSEICKNISLGKPQGKIQLQRLACKWEDNTKIDFRAVRHKGAD